MNGPLLPPHQHVPEVNAETSPDAAAPVLATRDHDVIREWAARHGAEPATGEATASGPATRDITDGGAGVRFNFPGASLFRPITWEEWLEHFDRHELAFVYENSGGNDAQNLRYRIVKAKDWAHVIG